MVKLAKVARGRSITRPFTFNDLVTCHANGKIPVLLVPGIMGSTEQGIATIYPMLPKRTPAWNSRTLSLLNPVGKVGWSALASALKQQGYQQGCTLFEVPYDWSLPVTKIRDQYLIPWIREAEKRSGSNKVDIIAHSMGGLVTRSYIQSSKYAKDVKKFAMVGTPNKGATAPYYMWEGGDPIKADKAAGPPGMYFYTNSLVKFAQNRFGQTLCQFSHFSPYTPVRCHNKRIYDRAHKDAQSVGQLMPTYLYALRNSSGSDVAITSGENSLIKALNGIACLTPSGRCYHPNTQIPYHFTSPAVMTQNTAGVQTAFFVGVGQKTPQTIFVQQQPSGYTGVLYPNGIPQRVTRSQQGDGTVLQSSVVFLQNSNIPVATTSGGHAELIKRFTPKLVQFIVGSGVSLKEIRASLPQTPAPADYFRIKTTGDVQPQISFTDAQGHSKALTPQTAYGLNKSVLLFKNPPLGQYHIEVTSAETTDYHLSVDYMNPQTDALKGSEFANTISSGASNQFTMTLTTTSGQNGKQINYSRLLNAPDAPTLTDSGGNIQLTWQDAAGSMYGDVKDYQVYWRLDTQPYYQLLGTTSGATTAYLTTGAWVQAADNTYVVKAVLKNGKSTVFSAPSFYVAS